MQTYEIDTDLSDQRRSYLKTLLTFTALFGVLLFPFGASEPLDFKLAWGVLFVGLFISDQLRRRKWTRPAEWAYLLTLLVTFSFTFANYGPTITNFVLMLAPVALALLLIEAKSIAYLAGLTIAIMFGIIALQTNAIQAFSVIFFPALLCG